MSACNGWCSCSVDKPVVWLPSILDPSPVPVHFFFFFKQKTAYEIGLGIPAEPLFRSNNVFRKFSAFHDETGRLNVDGMNIISNDGSNKLNRSRKARVSYKVQRTINASLNAATSTRAVSSNPNFVTRQKIEIIFG